MTDRASSNPPDAPDTGIEMRNMTPDEQEEFNRMSRVGMKPIPKSDSGELSEAIDRFEEAHRDYIGWANKPESMGVQGPNAQGFYQQRFTASRKSVLDLFERLRKERDEARQALAAANDYWGEQP